MHSFRLHRFTMIELLFWSIAVFTAGFTAGMAVHHLSTKDTAALLGELQ